MSLLSLVESGDREKLVQKLESISAGNSTKEFSERNIQNLNALDLAAVLGRQDLLGLLLDFGADINSANKSGYTAMHHSAAWGQVDCLQVLAERGADCNNLTRYKETPKDMAVRYGQQECVNYLRFHDECRKLKHVVNTRRATLTETDKITGKWNKEDKSKVTAICNEKSDWLNKKRRDSTLDDVQQQIEDFEQKMEPYIAKLT